MNPIPDRLRRPFLILGIFLALFLAARAVLYVAYARNFGSLTAGERLFAFLDGFRFDLSIVLSVAGLPLLLLALPFSFAARRGWQRGWGWAAWAVFVFFSLSITGDLVYFGYVNRHVGPEVKIMEEDLDQSLELVVREYPLALVALAAVIAGSFLLWRRLQRPVDFPPVKPILRPVWVAAAAGLVFLGIRGGWGGERLTIETALESHPASAASLALNGPFSAIHSLVASTSLRLDYVPEEEALRTARGMLFATGETAPDPEFPLYRGRPGRPGARPNVVLLVLEGWSAESLDGFRAEAGEAPLGLTPRFDALALEGRLFTRFFACGQRTRNGVAALVCGYPSIPGLPYIGAGLERMRLRFLGTMAQEEGYRTIWLQGSARGSQRLDAVAAAAGFEDYFGAEDFEGGNAGDDLLSSTKAWDHVLLERSAETLSAAREPFLAYIHTACTHAPMKYPPEFERFPPDGRQHTYFNALAYSDDSVGRFFDAVRQEPWFSRTVFVLVSDHVQRYVSEGKEPPEDFHIPCLVIGPGIAPGRDDRIGSQTDVIPTIAHAAGWAAPHAAFGRSLLDEAGRDRRGALMSASRQIVWVDEDGWVQHTLRSRIAFGLYRAAADPDAIERRMLGMVQVAGSLLLRNALCPEE